MPGAAAFALLALLGLAVGAFGTLVGAGGGFILTPVLLIVYKHDPPSTITAISLAVVFFNAASGTFAYARQRRVDYRSGVPFALATLPGAVGGALLSSAASRRLFSGILGAMLAGLGGFLLLRGRPRVTPHPHRGSERVLVDADGVVHRYRVPVLRGVIYSIGVGFVSSFLGIGGGVIHVPLLVAALGVPVHVATATSHFVLSIMALVGTGTHVAQHDFDASAVTRTVALSVGVVVGAQGGAVLSRRLPGEHIQRLLAVALIGLAVRLLLGAA